MPPSSSHRSVSHPLWRSLKVVLGVLLIGVVTFVGITRTQVGRNTIRAQVETAFNERFAGTLTLGSLSGTLVDAVVATDVQLQAPSGAVVATVDTVRAIPQWANLLTAELSVRQLTLVEPHLTPHRDSTGTWDLRQALRPTSPSSRTGQPFDLTFTDIVVRNGRLTTSRAGAAPPLVQNEWLFDYTQAAVHDISLRATAQRMGTQGVLDIEEAQLALQSSNLRVTTAEGRLQATDTGWSLFGLDLSLDTTRLRGRATLESPSSADGPAALTLDLNRSRIDNDEVRRLVPRLPLAQTVTLEGTLRGTTERLRATGVTVTHNASFATVDGTVGRANGEIALDLHLSDSRLRPRDVRDVWPSLPPLPNPALESIRLEGHLSGTTSQRPELQRAFDLNADLTARSPHGTVQGSLRVTRPHDAPLTYRTSVQTDALNLAPFTGRPALTSALNGTVTAAGTEGDMLPDTLSISLDASRIAGRPLASADGRVRLQGPDARGTLTVRQADGGRLYLKSSVDHLSERPALTAVATTTALDLAPLGGRLPETDLNARLTLRASGTDWKPLSGTSVVNVDSSAVYRGDSTVVLPPHSVTVHLADRTSDQPRLQVSGSLGSLTVDGTSLGPSLWESVRTWSTAMRETVRRERNKPAPQTPLASLQPPSRPSPDAPTARAAPRSRPLTARADLRVQQPSILHGWWGAFPERADDLTANAELSIGSDTLHAAGHVSADYLQAGPREVDSLAARYELSGRYGDALAQTIEASASVSAHRAVVGGPALFRPSATLTYGKRRGSLTITTDSVGIADSIRLVSDLRVTPRTNELRVRELTVTTNGNQWTNRAPASLHAYANTLVVTPLELRRPHPQTPSLQPLRIAGAVSSRPTDTLTVQATNVYLPPFSPALGLPHVVGGNLNGSLQLRSGWGRPQLISDFAVRRLSYDRRLLGDARLQMEYSATSPDLTVSGALNADANTTADLAGPDLVPNGVRTVDPNALSLSGRIRLPQWARAGPLEEDSALPAGETLDLSFNVTRADLFFFRYIFEERVSRVRGYAAGPVHIGGRFRDPIFDADLTIRDGAVTLPLFGLAYTLEGPVGVDERGIHVRNVAVADEEGTATVNGSILFNDYQYFSFDLSASLSGLTVIDVPQAQDLPFYGHIRGSGPLSLTGPLSDATLRSNSARTTPDSELYIPVSGSTVNEDTGFIVLADSTGRAPDVQTRQRRQNILGDRPEGVPTFVEGLNLDFNLIAPDESTVHLVFDPLVGDVVTVVGSGRVQLRRQEGDFTVYGSFDATSGTYLFTAGEVFVRRFAINQGTITWDGSPTNARLNLDAEYRTRASPSGLPGFQNYRGRIPVTVQLGITGRVATPQVDLSLALAREEQRNLVGSESLDAILNQPARTTEYATSVLLTNTFLLTTESITQGGQTPGDGSNNRLATAGNQLAFNSVSQLVSSQLNRYLGQALPNVDLNFGVQGEDPNNLDLIYGVALRLLNERLVIRGEGVYTSDDPDTEQAQGPQGEFVVEVRLSSRMSAKVFYRRTGDELTRNRALTSSRGAGLSYQTRFSNWKTLFHRLFGWLFPSDEPPADGPSDAVARDSLAPPDSTTVVNTDI